MPSLAMTLSVHDSKGIKNVSLFPVSSLDPNPPSRIHYSFDISNILFMN